MAGTIWTALLGGAAYVASVAILLGGTHKWNFYGGMMCCGIGWNLCFSAATVMLESCYEEKDASRVQVLYATSLIVILFFCSTLI